MIITHVEPVGKDKLRIALDEGGGFCLYRKEACHLQLEPGSELTDAQYGKIREEILIPRARKRTLYLLEKMDRTEAQLRDKLRQGYYPEAIIEDAIAYVKKFHYVDDLRYACNYVRAGSKTKSRRLLALELAGKGISRELAQQALQEEYDTEEESVKISRWLDKKHYCPEEADQKQKQRMYQFLLRKGFRSEDILKEL